MPEAEVRAMLFKMLFLAHSGIALGVAVTAAGILNPVATGAASGQEISKSPVLRGLRQMNAFMARGLAGLSRVVDIRLFVIASLLPDIIDKPLGLWLLPHTLATGRSYAHTLLFFLLILLVGTILLAIRRCTWLLLISAAVFIHLMLDAMWNTPITFYWPLYGASFPSEPTGDFIGRMLTELVNVPAVWIGDLIGLLIMAWLLYLALVHNKLGLLLRTGRLI
jgi:inner membrane protein